MGILRNITPAEMTRAYEEYYVKAYKKYEGQIKLAGYVPRAKILKKTQIQYAVEDLESYRMEHGLPPFTSLRDAMTNLAEFNVWRHTPEQAEKNKATYERFRHEAVREIEHKLIEKYAPDVVKSALGRIEAELAKIADKDIEFWRQARLTGNSENPGILDRALTDINTILRESGLSSLERAKWVSQHVFGSS